MSIYNFENAQELQKANPETFSAPSAQDLAGLTRGTFVKVCLNDERFWSIIISIEKDSIIARVNNELVLAQPFKCGDVIEFHGCNIYQILEGAEDGNN